MKDISRRLFLGAVITAGVSVMDSSSAEASSYPDQSMQQESAGQLLLSANGWPVETQPDGVGGIWTRSISGPNLLVPLQVGPVAEVLGHVVRRYHYEIAGLGTGDVIGFVSTGAADRESNHASGTAVDIRPGWYPVGTREGVPTREIETIQSILADCRGMVAWGGDGAAFDVAHFDIAVPPGDPRLDELASDLRILSDTPGVKPGALTTVG